MTGPIRPSPTATGPSWVTKRPIGVITAAVPHAKTSVTSPLANPAAISS